MKFCFCFTGITDENEILNFLEHGTLVGLLPVPHPILIRKFGSVNGTHTHKDHSEFQYLFRTLFLGKYQTNSGTTLWFRTYMYGVIFLRNIMPPIWYETDVKLFEIQKL